MAKKRYKVFAYGKWGLVNRNGNQVVPIMYDWIYAKCKNKYYVINNLKIGIIDADGKELLPCIYDWLSLSGYDWIVAVRDNNIVVIDENYKEIFSVSTQMYDYMDCFGECFLVKKHNKYGFLNKQFETCIPIKYDDMNWSSYLHFSLIEVELNNKYGLVDKYGKEIIPPIYDNIDMYYEDDDIICAFLDEKEVEIDAKGNVTPVPVGEDIKYSEIFSENDDYRNGLGYRDENGTIIIPPIFDFIHNDYNYDDEVFLVGKNKKWALVTSENNFQIPELIFDFIKRDEESNLYLARIKNKCGFIDKNNQVIIPIKYDYYGIYGSCRNWNEFHNGLAFVEEDGKWGYIDEQGKEILPVTQDFDWKKFQCFMDYSSNEFSFGKIAYYDINSWKLVPPVKSENPPKVVFKNWKAIVTPQKLEEN